MPGLLTVGLDLSLIENDRRTLQRVLGLTVIFLNIHLCIRSLFFSIKVLHTAAQTLDTRTKGKYHLDSSSLWLRC